MRRFGLVFRLSYLTADANPILRKAAVTHVRSNGIGQLATDPRAGSAAPVLAPNVREDADLRS